jgi:hypothetical protein
MTVVSTVFHDFVTSTVKRIPFVVVGKLLIHKILENEEWHG